MTASNSNPPVDHPSDSAAVERPKRRSRRLAEVIWRFWSDPVRVERYALCRIAVALVGLGVVLESVWPYLDLYWSDAGLFPTEIARDIVDSTWRWSLLDLGLSSRLVASALTAALVALLFGWQTRLATIVAWAAFLSFHTSSRWVLNGGDDVFLQSLFYLIFAPSGEAWSIDAWRRKERVGSEVSERGRGAAWPLRLIQIQLVVIYFVTGLGKLGGPPFDWLVGDAVYWSLQDITLNRWSYSTVPIPFFLTQLATWGTLVFEIGFPAWILWAKTRRAVLLAGIGLHISIWILLEISWFSPAMLALYTVFWRPRSSPAAG